MNNLSIRNLLLVRKQFFQYFFVGGVATGVDVGFFSLFSLLFRVDYRIAIVLGFLFGVATNFSLCNWVVFPGRRRPLWLVFARHLLASSAVLLVNEVVMISLVELFKYENLVMAKLMSSGMAFLINFFIKKRYVYNNVFYEKQEKQMATLPIVQRRSQG